MKINVTLELTPELIKVLEKETKTKLTKKNVVTKVKPYLESIIPPNSGALQLRSVKPEKQTTLEDIYEDIISHFVGDILPDDWQKLSDQEQSAFIADNPWFPLEHVDSSDIKSACYGAAEKIFKLTQEN